MLLFLVLFSSCKDSTLVTPTTKEPVVLFSKDSLAVSTSDSGMVGLADSVLYEIDTTVRNIQLDYYMESSGGVPPGDRVYYGVFLSKPGVSYFADYGYLFTSQIIDTSRTFDVSNFRGLTLKFKVAIENKTNYSFRYVRFRNMKLKDLN